MSNPSDNIIAIVEETTKGVTPANPAFRYAEVVNGGATLTYDMKELSSETMKRSRDMAGIRKVAGSGGGSLKFELSQNSVITDLIAAGLSAVKSGSTYKASNVDKSFTIQEEMTHEGVPFYYNHRNRQVSKVVITVDAEGKAQITFDFVGGAREHVDIQITGATFTTPAKGDELAGIDIGTIDIAGFTARYMALTITIEQAREANFALGERDAVEVGTTAAPRVVTVEAKAYRKDLAAENLFMIDTPVPVAIDLGSAGNGYGFDFPAMVGGVPKGEISGSKNLVNLTLKAQYDETADYGASFTVL